jgi:hypothetical protein
MLNRDRTAALAPLAWAVSDLVFLTAGLTMADDPLGPLLIAYPLVVVASGLWFEVRLVATTTVAALVSFAGLLAVRPESFGEPHYPLIFGAMLLVIGFTVGYQVHRLRALNRYFDQRRLV